MSRPRIVTIAAFLIVLFAPMVVESTTILAVSTPTDIYVGADSKLTRVREDGSVFYENTCKIVQLGNIFFAAAGPYSGLGLDIRLSIVESRAAGGTLKQIASRFADLYATTMTKTLQTVRKSSQQQYKILTSMPINVYFFGFDGGTPVSLLKTFTLETPQPANATSVRVREYDCPPGCANGKVSIQGIAHADALEGLSQASVENQSPVDLIRERIELSIKRGPTESGPPIALLHLTKQGGSWIQNDNHCPEIQAY